MNSVVEPSGRLANLTWHWQALTENWIRFDRKLSGFTVYPMLFLSMQQWLKTQCVLVWLESEPRTRQSVLGRCKSWPPVTWEDRFTQWSSADTFTLWRWTCWNSSVVPRDWRPWRWPTVPRTFPDFQEACDLEEKGSLPRTSGQKSVHVRGQSCRRVRGTHKWDNICSRSNKP